VTGESRAAPLSYTWTEDPASAVPDIVDISVLRGLVIGVMTGASGGVVSTIHVNDAGVSSLSPY
jgi:hypothetical protein